jgi:hypothetical protein
VEYPPLAKAARIQGEVHLVFGPNGIVPISGHPLLASAAIDRLKHESLTSSDNEAVYHFVLVEPEIGTAQYVMKIGNPFTRLFRRVLKLKTEEVVEGAACLERTPPINRIDLLSKPVEVWVYATIGCPQV